jgi:hypothetical protein
MAPSLDGFVRRGELDLLNDLLRAGAAGNAPTVLVGPEGFGKTALAQAICWDLRTRAAFSDGILWASLGERLDVHGRLTRFRELVRWWTRAEPPVFETAGAAGAHLCTLLAGRRVLLVIDGATSAADLTPFEGLTAGSTLLATTRITETESLPPNVQPLAIGPMATPEAIALLRSGLPPGAEGRLQALARRLGNWPLLLGIVNRQLRERAGHSRTALEEALQDVVRALEIVGFAGFDREDPEARRASVWRAIVVALRSLSSQERDRFLDLAVLPAEEDVPLAVVRGLWGLGPSEARKFCKRLRDLSLLRFDPWAGTLRFHSVLGGFLVRRRRDELPALHARLLDVCRPESGCWADLPAGETYLWRHLATHLLAAGRRGELRDLLLDLAFLRAKLEALDVHALLADFDLAAREDRELSLVGEALRQSAGALGSDHAQLAPQLLGRLLDRKERGLQSLLDAVRRDRERTVSAGDDAGRTHLLEWVEPE